MTAPSPIDVLVRGAGGLARLTELGPLLESILADLGAATGSSSGAIFVRDGSSGELTIAASLDLGEEAAAALSAAVRNPAHAVARTAATGESGFDVLPGNPGGPRLRTHLPVVVGSENRQEVIGVLALAHDEPIDPDLRPILGAAANLVAVAIERRRAT